MFDQHVFTNDFNLSIKQKQYFSSKKERKEDLGPVRGIIEGGEG